MSLKIGDRRRRCKHPPDREATHWSILVLGVCHGVQYCDGCPDDFLRGLMPIEPAKTIIKRGPVLVDLALQGGGSHGAFTWGVLDRLLEEPWLEIDGISGTSAGAMNAAVLADGYTNGGPSGAPRGP